MVTFWDFTVPLLYRNTTEFPLLYEEVSSSPLSLRTVTARIGTANTFWADLVWMVTLADMPGLNGVGMVLSAPKRLSYDDSSIFIFTTKFVIFSTSSPLDSDEFEISVTIPLNVFPRYAS